MENIDWLTFQIIKDRRWQWGINWEIQGYTGRGKIIALRSISFLAICSSWTKNESWPN